MPYYDQSGRVISEAVDVGGNLVIDREYIWDVNSPSQLVCRIQHLIGGTKKYLYPIYDTNGNVASALDNEGDVQERYDYDPQGNVTILDDSFQAIASQVSAIGWQNLYRGMRLDASGLYNIGSALYDSRLGMALPSGPISVLPMSMLNAKADGFPVGNYLSSKAYSQEQWLEWVGQVSPWVKAGIGIACLIGAAVVIAGSTVSTVGFGGVVTSIGAAAGAIHGGVEAYLSGGDFSDVLLGVGMGALFGAICPPGGIGALGGGLIGAGFGAIAGVAEGFDRNGFHESVKQGFQVGGLIGGISGSVHQGFLYAAADVVGAGAGAGLGYAYGQTFESAYHGATLGMFAAGIGVGIGKGLRSVGRGVRNHAPEGLDAATDFAHSQNYTRSTFQGPWYWRTLKSQSTHIDPKLTGKARIAVEAHEQIHRISNRHLPSFAWFKSQGGRRGLNGFLGSNASFYEEIAAYGREFWIRGQLDDVLKYAWRSTNKWDNLVGPGASALARRHILSGLPIVGTGAGAAGYSVYLIWNFNDGGG